MALQNVARAWILADVASTLGKEGVLGRLSPPHPTPPHPPPLDAPCGDLRERLRRVVHDVRDVSDRPGIERVRAVGDCILHAFFSGDVARMRARATRVVWFRRLAEHPDLPFGPATLYELVRAYNILSSWPELSQTRHLKPCHVRAVFALEGTAQRDLLVEAERRRWSVRVLGQRVRARWDARPTRRGRPAHTPLTRAAIGLERAAVAARETVEGAPELGEVAAEAVGRLTRALDSVEDASRAMRRRLAARGGSGPALSALSERELSSQGSPARHGIGREVDA